MFGLSKKEREKELAEHQNIEELASKYLLTVSEIGYAESLGRHMSDYNLRCVDAEMNGRDFFEVHIKVKELMVYQAQELGAEAVVSIRPSESLGFERGPSVLYYHFYMIGTAMIPKKPEEIGD